MTDPIEITVLVAIDELYAVEELQRAVWGMPEREIVPAHQLLAASRAGGVVLGAYAHPKNSLRKFLGTPSLTKLRQLHHGGRALVGFCYGFLGVRDGEPIFVSHMAGVLTSHRSSGVGFLLKRAQREAALARRVDRIVWTYDPLASLNAHFNLHKLGATAARYFVNYYGEMQDDLNRGLPSDRLEVDWWLRHRRVESLMRGESAPPASTGPAALRATASPGGPTPQTPDLTLQGPGVRVEIPTAFGDIKRRDRALALAWLLSVRQTMQHYFGLGYQAVDFETAGTVGSYILTRDSLTEGTGPPSKAAPLGKS